MMAGSRVFLISFAFVLLLTISLQPSAMKPSSWSYDIESMSLCANGTRLVDSGFKMSIVVVVVISLALFVAVACPTDVCFVAFAFFMSFFLPYPPNTTFSGFLGLARKNKWQIPELGLDKAKAPRAGLEYRQERIWTF
jgi:hypothetical protein